MVEGNSMFCEDGLTVGQALREGRTELCRTRIQSAWLEAEVLLRNVLGWDRARLYANLDAVVDSRSFAMFLDLVGRRCLGEPTAYLVGRREFFSLDFFVAPGVLIPRPETEHLVETALDLLEVGCGSPRILELGTGSGAVAVSLAKERENIEVWATDISNRALETARLNAARHGVEDRIHFCRGDLFAALENGSDCFHGVVFNPPYLGRESMGRLPREVRDWEPQTALYGGPDGLDFYRRVATEAHLYIDPHGFVACEISPEISWEVRQLFQKDRWYDTGVVRKDHSGRDRVFWTRGREERGFGELGPTRG